MKILVTGGSGFIGSHVVDKLIDKGFEVKIFDGVMPTHRRDVEFYKGNIMDLGDLRMALFDIDIIYHLAAIADVKDVYEDPYFSEQINTRGTLNVLEATRRSGHIERVIYSSTIWVYSDCKENTVDENTSISPPSHMYTATKLASEYYCKAYSNLYGIDTTILRYGIPYGPRARDGAVIPIFVKKVISGEPITIAGDGHQYRKFVYVEDLAEGNVLALKSVAKNKIYNLEGTEKTTIKQIAMSIQSILGKEVNIEYTSSRPGDFSGQEILNHLAEKELGWKPKTIFKDGLKKYIKWFVEKEEKRRDLIDIDKILE